MKCLRTECIGEVFCGSEHLHWVNLQVKNKRFAFTCIQEAINNMKMEETLQNVETTCPVCGRGSAVDQHEWVQKLRIVENPDVLMLVLNRWDNLYGASLHTVKATPHVYFNGRRFLQCAILVPHLPQGIM